MKSININLIFLLCFSAMTARAAVFNVNSTGTSNDANNGDGICATSVGGTNCTLRAALTEANALAGADTINLPANTYNPSFREFISDELEIVGAGSESTIIDGNGFVVDTTSPVSISGVTIQNGGIASTNAIFLNPDSDLTLTDLRISNFSAAAIDSASAGFDQLVIDNSRIEGGNGTGITYFYGGGLNLNGGTASVSNSTVVNNTADFGGGLFLNGTVLTLINSTVTGNSSTAPGNVNGGFGGGGILMSGSASLTAINSTISGNAAVSSGGGIVIDDGTVLLFNTTITNNEADSDSDLVGSGGGIIASSGAFSTTNILQLRNSIVAANAAALNDAIDCSSTNLTITSFGYNLLGNGSDTDCIFTPASGDQLGTVLSIDPMLAVLADNGGPTQTHALLAGSPAIDGGNPSGCEDDMAAALTTDQRGFSRPLDGGIGSAVCDIGAFEANVLPLADAGADQTVQFGDNVVVDGSASSAFAGIASYSWAETPSSTVTLNNASTDTANFTAPSSAGVLSFELTVTDNNAAIDVDTVSITVNDPPVADAGMDMVVNGGDSVSLDGTNSTDSDGTIDSFSWTQTAGTTVILNKSDSNSPDFTAPGVPGDVLTFELTATDDTGAADTDMVNITVNRPPVADAGADQTASRGELVMLDGTGCSDPDGSIQSTTWAQTGGVAVVLMNASTANPQFTVPDSAAGNLVFRVTATDNNGATDTDEVTVAVDSTATDSGSSDSGGGAPGLWMISILLLLRTFRCRRARPGCP